jgi:integrase
MFTPVLTSEESGVSIGIYIRIRRADGTRQYAPIAKTSNGKIKPLHALVDGIPEHHPEGEYNLRVTIDGKRKWLPVGNDPAAVLASKMRREADMVEGIAPACGAAPLFVMPERESGGSEPTAPKQQHPLQDAAAVYLAEVKTGKSKRTFAVYSYTIEEFLKVSKASTVESISRRDVLNYIEERKEVGNTKRTISNHVMHLRTFCNHFGMKLPLLKTDKSLYKYTEKNVRAYSREDIDDLFAAADQEDTELFDFFLKTGGRDQEVQFASWADLDFARRKFNITEHLDLGFTPKDKEEGSIPIPGDLVDMLRERRKRYPKSRLIFGQGERGDIPDGHFLRRLKELAFRAGLNCGQCYNKAGECCAEKAICGKWILHRFRKTFATWHHENGVSARRIQRWLRHSDLETTLKYLAGTDDETEEMQQTVDSTFAPKPKAKLVAVAA